MPNGSNLPAPSLSQWVTDIYLDIIARFLSKEDAAILYVPRSEISQLYGSSGGVYSTYSDAVNPNNVDTNVVMSSPTSTRGSLVFAPGQLTAGDVLHFHMFIHASTSAETIDTLNICIKTQSGTVITNSFEYNHPVSNEPIVIDTYLTITSTQIRATGLGICQGSPTSGFGIYSEVAFNPNVTNTFTVTSAWPATGEASCTLKQLVVTVIASP